MGDTEKCLLIMIEKYQTEKKIVGDKKENRNKFSFMKDSSAERSSKLFKSRSSCSTEAFCRSFDKLTSQISSSIR